MTDKGLWLIAYTVVVVLNPIECLTGYICNTGNINKTTISLMDRPDCRKHERNVTKENVRVVVSQNVLMEDIEILRCKVVAHHQVSRCGRLIDTMHQAGVYGEPLYLSYDECIELKRSGRLTGPGGARLVIPHGLTSFRFSYTSWGSISDGQCSPGPALVYGSQSWDRPVRNTDLEVIVVESHARIDFEDGTITLPNGVRCQLKDEYCHVDDYGSIFWKRPVPDCNGDPRAKVFDGQGELVTSESGNKIEKYIQVVHGGHSFQIQIMERTLYVCGFLSYYTEHTRLFVTILTPGSPEFPLKRELTDLDVSLTTYINSKLIYVQRNIRDQVENLFNLFQNDRCLAHTKIIDTMMTLALVNPREFSYQYFNQPGHVAIARGEVLHVAKCHATEVIPKPFDGNCYNELPVLVNNKTMFLTPRTRVLTTIGTIVECSGLSPTFKIGEAWVIQTSTGLSHVKDPDTFKLTELDYKFESLDNLASSGIYTDSAIDSMQRALLSPIEETALTSRLVKAMSGTPLPEGVSFVDAFSNNDFLAIEDRVSSWYERWIKKCETFGQVASVFVAFVIFVKVISFVLSSIINFKELAKIFGFCTALMYCWCDSFTHHKLRKEQEEDTQLRKRTTSQLLRDLGDDV
jgi:hypothetical protein